MMKMTLHKTTDLIYIFELNVKVNFLVVHCDSLTTIITNPTKGVLIYVF